MAILKQRLASESIDCHPMAFDPEDSASLMQSLMSNDLFMSQHIHIVSLVKQKGTKDIIEKILGLPQVGVPVVCLSDSVSAPMKKFVSTKNVLCLSLVNGKNCWLILSRS